MRDFKTGTLTVDAAIIGAGPAGLTAGYLLARAGKSVAIIEKDDAHVGGLSRAVEHEGCRIDIGGQRFFSASRAVVDLWNELLPGGWAEQPRTSRIYCGGKFYACPPRPLEVLANLGLLRATACALSYLRHKVMPVRDAGNCDAWAANRFGRQLHSIFLKPYAEKVWGVPCDEISADWAAQRFERWTLWNALAGRIERPLGLARPSGGRPATPRLVEGSRPPRLGAGSMWRAARDRIVEMGGAVLMGRPLDQLAADGQGGWRLAAAGPDGTVVIRAAHAISSAPLRELAARLHPLPATTWNASKLKYRDFLTVALKMRSHALPSADPIYVNDGELKVCRVHDLGAWSSGTAPGDGAGCLGLGYFCSEDDGLWSMADDELVALAAGELDALGLASPGDVLGGMVVRQEKACPVYDEGYAANVAALRCELEAKYPTLHLVGRNGMHRYDNLDQAMTSATLAVANILAGERRYDAWRMDASAAFGGDVETAPSAVANGGENRPAGPASASGVAARAAEAGRQAA